MSANRIPLYLREYYKEGTLADLADLIKVSPDSGYAYSYQVVSDQIGWAIIWPRWYDELGDTNIRIVSIVNRNGYKLIHKEQGVETEITKEYIERIRER